MTMNGKATTTLGFVLSAIAITAAMGAGAGARLALWDFRLGFGILNWAAYFGIAGTVLSLMGMILVRPGIGGRGFLPAVAGVVLGALAFGVPGNWYRIAKAEGRIEATATTRWFGFKDDVVIRIVPSAVNGSRVDIRSVSRVGLSDVGTNARRIRTFLKKFAEASKSGG